MEPGRRQHLQQERLGHGGGIGRSGFQGPQAREQQQKHPDVALVLLRHLVDRFQHGLARRDQPVVGPERPVRRKDLHLRHGVERAASPVQEQRDVRERLQAGSDAVADHVRRMCEELGVPLITERRASLLPPGSVQARARELRYSFLEHAARRAEAPRIALAHTADDVVEGAVMHLLRGCGIAGLRGMPERRGVFVRPLLQVWRREIDAFLASRSMVSVTDPANSDRAVPDGNPQGERAAGRLEAEEPPGSSG